MRQDVLYVGGTAKDFTPSFMFNIKFRFEDAEINYSNQPILKPDSVWHRYNLMDKKGPFEFEKDDLMDKKGPFEFEKDEDGNTKVLDTSIFERILEGGKILIDPLHKKIQNAVVDLLKKDYNSIQVESGALDSIKQRVDIKGFSKNEQEWHFFEVKTMSAKRSIREALGQILEYAHYPNVQLAEKLFIISPEKPDEKDNV